MTRDYELLVQKRILMPSLPSMSYAEVVALNEWVQRAFVAIRADEREQAARIAWKAVNEMLFNNGEVSPLALMAAILKTYGKDTTNADS